MPQQYSQYSSILIFLAMIAVFYFFVLRPQKKRTEEAKQMRSSVKVGDQIVTIGGIRGRITAIRDDAYEIETGSEGQRMEILKQALSYVVTAVDGYGAQMPKEETEKTAASEGEEAPSDPDRYDHLSDEDR